MSSSMDVFIARWEEDLKSASQEMRNAAALSMILYITSNISFAKPGQEPVEGFHTVLKMLGQAVKDGKVTSDPVLEWLEDQQDNQRQIVLLPGPGKSYGGPKR